MIGSEHVERLRHRINVALGREPADLVVAGGQVLNVFTGRLTPADVAIAGQRIAGVGAYQGRLTVDASGRYVLPGLIDAHVHIESCMLTPRRFAEAVVPRGTTTVIAEPHELANVLGKRGVEFLIEASRDLILRVFFTVPSCVPASPFETPGATLDPDDVAELIARGDRIVGLAEVMNYPGVIAGEDGLLREILATGRGNVDGHAPGVLGAALQAYAAAGVQSDHECTSPAEARERLEAGMWLMAREGSAAQNLAELAPLLIELRPRRALLVSDDVDPADLLSKGHLDRVLRRAVELGIDPVEAVRMATIAPAERFGLARIGAIAPGYTADMVVVDDLDSFRAREVIAAGRVVAQNGRAIFEPPSTPALDGGGVYLGDLGIAALRLPDRGSAARVIEVRDRQIITTAGVATPRVENGYWIADPDRDLALLAVIDRHHGSGRAAVCYVRGTGLARGALASTVQHDAHQLIALGASPEEILDAAHALATVGGGLACRAGTGEHLVLPLPYGGLMSDLPAATVASELDRLHRAARELGCRLSNPFATLSFLGLSVIPSLKLTDQGLVDVDAFELVTPYL